MYITDTTFMFYHIHGNPLNYKFLLTISPLANRVKRSTRAEGLSREGTNLEVHGVLLPTWSLGRKIFALFE